MVCTQLLLIKIAATPVAMVIGAITRFCAGHCEAPAAWPSTALVTGHYREHAKNGVGDEVFSALLGMKALQVASSAPNYAETAMIRQAQPARRPQRFLASSNSQRTAVASFCVESEGPDATTW